MRIAAPLLALLVLLAGTVPAVALAAPGPARSGPTPAPAADRPALAGPSTARITAPTVTEIYVAPGPGGDARWNVSIHYNLSTEADRAAFDRYGRAFEAGDADVGLDVEFFRTLATEASSATGREMTIRSPEWNATAHNGSGVLSLSFTWTNFVNVTADGFRVQDGVLMPGDRTWLASIGPSQRLVVETPPGYQVTDSRFGLENGSVVVDGPHTFREPLTISYQETATEDPGDGPPWLLVGGALLVGLGAVAAVVYVRRSGRESTAPDGEESAPTGPVAAGVDDTGATEPADDSADLSDEATTPSEQEGDETAESAAVDLSLLSDEERVEHLLQENGGRMKQARIVQETGWSDAKVSQLLSTMAEEGRVEKLRLGRENLISLPDEEP